MEDSQQKLLLLFVKFTEFIYLLIYYFLQMYNRGENAASLGWGIKTNLPPNLQIQILNILAKEINVREEMLSLQESVVYKKKKFLN